MFIAFIALALELVALAFGAKVALDCCYRANHHYYSDRETTKGHHNKRESHHGFLKFIGYFTMAVSFIALVCTLITLSCFMVDVKRLEREHRNDGSSEQYRYDLDKLRIYSGVIGNRSLN